jgi:hypothetical protein
VFFPLKNWWGTEWEERWCEPKWMMKKERGDTHTQLFPFSFSSSSSSSISVFQFSFFLILSLSVGIFHSSSLASATAGFPLHQLFAAKKVVTCMFFFFFF